MRNELGGLASGVYMFIVELGSGMFNSPNTAAMMGTVPAHRRGIAAGARVLVQNTRAVISIAFVLAVVTSSVPKARPAHVTAPEDAVRPAAAPQEECVAA